MRSELGGYIAALLSVPLMAQTKNLPSKGIPKGADGKVNLSAAAPRSSDGHPDLSGIWEPSANIYLRDIAADLKPAAFPFSRGPRRCTINASTARSPGILAT